MSAPSFTKMVIGELENDVGASPMNTLFTLGDMDSDGFVDIVVSGRNGMMAWFRNPGSAGRWDRRPVNDVAHMECGGLVYDLTGSGYPDIINGSDYAARQLYWWENPGPHGGLWTPRVIFTAPGSQFHDELVGDVTGDGCPSLIFSNQGSQNLYRAPIPEDPRQVPWPGVELIATGMIAGRQPEEGLALADLDGDGKNEIIAGTHWLCHSNQNPGEWEIHKFANDYICTVIAVGDLDQDGRPEIVLAEGDACIYGKPQGGKLAWFKSGPDIRKPWEEHLIADGLLDPHSVQLADLCGNGRLDILVGEIGVKETYRERPPRLMIYENLGAGEFIPHVIDEGTGTHHAKLADFRHRGVLDIASRPLHGDKKWQIHVYYNNHAGL